VVARRTNIQWSFISATSTDSGDAGNVTITTGYLLALMNSSISTETASGEAIKITTNSCGEVDLVNSTISASVMDGTGGGGSVNIDPEIVVMQNSQILANSVFGRAGTSSSRPISCCRIRPA
jgi:large exoprotein involved in heme utilization and adhesion